MYARVEINYIYFSFDSEVEGWEFWKPTEFRRQYLAGTLERFDFVFTYSSLEHCGLGTVFLHLSYSLSALCQ